MSAKQNPVDLRSDTVTKPDPVMREAMANAQVGDDVLEGDPTVRALEERVAALFGKEAALFVPSGTMANQLALRSQTNPSEAVICHEESHVIFYETGAPAAISGVMCAAARGKQGIFDVDEINRLFRDNEAHNAPTTLLVLENTHNRGGGSVWPIEQYARVCTHARGRGLRVHLDGARIWNAVAATGINEREWGKHADSISCCFSKGLGAPIGSALIGDNVTITRARRFRKMLGGSMRQAGIIAAAAMHAVEHNRARLKDDHRRTSRLAELVSSSAHARIHEGCPQTNMIYFDLVGDFPSAAEMCKVFGEAGVLMLPEGMSTIRAVCHLHITDDDIERAGNVIVNTLG
ncbi:MAG: aminotransferase class I/II-fold pyridoxal phosphate-dependent enzyme [Phycisphaeraceae bacterium]|nr:aminotransferase class I/II-fold pyridoxal phosphate-dependent enzyme [Phycisphaerales bacterium]MCB9861144.1 aminotransferase class I/II-fold pyridoxal phosphate-dependent enzyme [Phycisphaeraceae bacterium]